MAQGRPGRSRAGQVSPDERTIRLARKRFARRQWSRRWLLWRRVLVTLLVLAALAGVLAAIFPARRAARLDVLRALAYE